MQKEVLRAKKKKVLLGTLEEIQLGESQVRRRKLRVEKGWFGTILGLAGHIKELEINGKSLGGKF